MLDVQQRTNLSNYQQNINYSISKCFLSSVFFIDLRKVSCREFYSALSPSTASVSLQLHKCRRARIMFLA